MAAPRRRPTRPGRARSGGRRYNNPQRSSVGGGWAGITTGITVMVIAIALVLGKQFSPRFNYEIRADTLEFVKDPYKGEIPSVPIEEIMARREMGDTGYYRGRSLVLVFTERRGPAVTSDTVYLPPWGSYNEGGGARPRVHQVDSVLAVATQKAAEFAKNTPITRRYAFALDDTDGVQAEDGERVRRVIDEFDPLAGLANGDTVEVYLTRLTSGAYRDFRKLWFAGTNGAAARQELTDSLQWLIEARGAASQSSIAMGILNSIMEFEGKPATIVVISDGQENTGYTANFQQKRELLLEANWASTDQALTQYLERLPVIPGSSIHWVFPPGEDVFVAALRRYWTHLLSKTQAKVTTDYRK